MDVITDLREYEGTGSAHAVTIGAYDGVHRGHQAVIAATKALAVEKGIRSGLITFDPHPAQVVRPDSAPKLLVDAEQRQDLLAACGIDTLFVVPFDHVRAAETPEEFVSSVLVGCAKAKAIVVGEDFHFGKNRAGDVGLLARLGETHGFEVQGIDLLNPVDAPSDQTPPREAISSTAIRNALAAGEVEVAASLLGRYHELRGPVVQGDQRGRTIGFPTANVAVPANRAVPADGVYAGWYLRPDGSRHPAAINVGKRPTFYADAEHSVIEPHLIGFTGDLYGETARVQFVARLRDERRFDGIDALKTQLAVDVVSAKQVLLPEDTSTLM